MSRRVSRRIYLALLAIVVAYCASQLGGRNLTVLNSALLATGLLVTVYWIRAGASESAPEMHPRLRGAVLLLPAYIALQLVPLPLPLLRLLSPERAGLVDRLASVTQTSYFASISIAPAITFQHLLRMAGYTLVFLLIRDIAWHSLKRRSWAAAIPLMVIATVEAVAAISQSIAGAEVEGTYANKNHLAGLLEMVLPLTAAYGLSFLQAERTQRTVPVLRALRAVGLLVLSIVLFAALLLSLSKMAFAAALGGLFVMGGLAVWSIDEGPGRKIALATLAALVVFFMVFVPSDELMKSFMALFSDEWSTGEGRFPTWIDTLRLMRDYPLVGCGLGNYGTAFLKFQTAIVDKDFTWAHNDYLQIASELGAVGFGILAVLLGVVFIHALRAALHSDERSTRFLGLGCVGAMTAIGLHSLTDFNMYIPANALVMAWICGIATSLPRRSRKSAPAVTARGPIFSRVLSLAFGALLILYAPAWIIFETSFRTNPAAERIFCRFGICDTDAVIAAETDAHAGNVALIPKSTLVEALRREPAAPHRWADLGDALLKANDLAGAQNCFSTAQALGPYIPPILLRVANFQFATHQGKQALQTSALVLDKTSTYDDLIFQTYSSNNVAVKDVLSDGLPRNARPTQAYLREMLSLGNKESAAATWEWGLAHHSVDDKLAAEYVNFVYRDQRYDAAAQAFALYLGNRRHGYLESDWLYNGDFESEPLGVPFDWRIENLGEDVDVARDSAIAHSGTHSLRLRFHGKSNVNYSHSGETLYVPAGTYRFEAFVRTDQLTTDQGIHFLILDPESSARVSVKTRQITGTNDWTRVEETVNVPAVSRLLQIQIVREPSLKFDSLISGTAWIDRVRLTRIAQSAR
jgi:O-antigen ligase